MALGFTVIPQYARRAFPRQNEIAVVDGDPRIVDTLWLVHRSEWPLSRRARRVIEELSRLLAAAGGGSTASTHGN
ncbi:hypothetical protein QNH14_12260 [Apirhabdus apintestini]|nr:hypothetical protein QNH14_12260 [Enterobacteriaceae bacterium CA-0114]